MRKRGKSSVVWILGVIAVPLIIAFGVGAFSLHQQQAEKRTQTLEHIRRVAHEFSQTGLQMQGARLNSYASRVRFRLTNVEKWRSQDYRYAEMANGLLPKYSELLAELVGVVSSVGRRFDMTDLARSRLEIALKPGDAPGFGPEQQARLDQARTLEEVRETRDAIKSELRGRWLQYQQHFMDLANSLE